MNVVKRTLDSIHPDPANARVHDDKNIEAIKNSLLEFTQYQPLVIQKSSGKILVGNGRYTAIQQLKEEGRWSADEVDCVVLDINDVKAAMLAITDNRSSELGRWDNSALAQIIEQLQREEEEDFDLGGLGWEDTDLAAVLEAEGDDCGNSKRGSDDNEDAPDDFEEMGEDVETDYKCPKCGYEWNGQPR